LVKQVNNTNKVIKVVKYILTENYHSQIYIAQSNERIKQKRRQRIKGTKHYTQRAIVIIIVYQI
jgi:phage anti-repressor protein